MINFVTKIMKWLELVFVAICCLLHTQAYQCYGNQFRIFLVSGTFWGILVIMFGYTIGFLTDANVKKIADTFFVTLSGLLFIICSLVIFEVYLNIQDGSGILMLIKSAFSLLTGLIFAANVVLIFLYPTEGGDESTTESTTN